MKRMGITFEDGFKEVHFDFSTGDAAICGQDLIGDDSNNSEHGAYYEATEEKHTSVNCQHCLDIVKECKTIRLKKLEKGE